MQRYLNVDASVDLLGRCARPNPPGEALLQEAARSLSLSARAYHRVLKVARTIADLEASEEVRRIHIAEALSYRRRPIEEMETNALNRLNF